MDMNLSGFLSKAIDGTVRIGFVIVPTVKASTYLLEIATRTLAAALKTVGMEVKLPEVISEKATAKEKEEASIWSKMYTKVHDYLPAVITKEKKIEERMTLPQLAVGFALYASISIVTTFAANKLIRPMPEIYNQVAAFSGLSLRIDTKYDVIQVLLDRMG